MVLPEPGQHFRYSHYSPVTMPPILLHKQTYAMVVPDKQPAGGHELASIYRTRFEMYEMEKGLNP